MLNENITGIVSQSYSKIGELSLKLVRNIDNGYGNSASQAQLWDRSKRIRKILKAVLDHIVFDDNGNYSYSLHTTDETLNILLKCLVELTDIQDYPVAPILFHKVKPRNYTFNAPGVPGPPGPPGIDATVDVIPEVGEDEISVAEEVILGVRTFKLNFSPYVAPQLAVSINAPKVYEIGVVVGSKTLSVISTKGKNTIVSIQLSDVTLDTAFQGTLNFPVINGVTQPVTNSIAPTNISVNTVYQATLMDDSGKPAGTVIKSDSINFYYPFLYGATDNTGDDPYLFLTKIIEALGNKTVLFNATNKYFWIGYPASYGLASQILDQNGFDAIGAFSTFTVNVTSQGLTNNWTVSYRFYRTTLKTTIANANYTLKF